MGMKALPATVVPFLAGVALLALVASARAVQAQRAPSDQADPDVVFLREREEHLLVWSEDRGAGNRLYTRRVGANGLAVPGPNRGAWEATRLRQGEQPGDQRWPAVIERLLVYSERKPGASDYDLYAQRLFDNGRPSGLPMAIVAAPGDQRYADVVAIERERGEDYLVVWSEDTRDKGDVMGVRIDFALRRSRGAPFPIAQGPGTAEDPTINRDPIDDRQLLVLYTDDRSGNRDVYGVRLADSGLPRGGPVAGTFPVVEAPEDDYAPALLANLDRTGGRLEARHLLVWTRDHVTEGPNVRAQRIDRNGLPKGRDYEIAGGPGVQAWPSAGLRRVFDRRGRREPDEWLVVWADDQLGTLDIQGVRIGLYGQLLTRPRWLATD